jgi:hypothetical protein
MRQRRLEVAVLYSLITDNGSMRGLISVRQPREASHRKHHSRIYTDQSMSVDGSNAS